MKPLKIGVVGPCASGKSTLKSGLSKTEFITVQIAQEHSYVHDMWRRLTNPDVLIYLDVSYPVTKTRRKLYWTEKEYLIQVNRLNNARENADLYINTDNISPSEVLDKVNEFLDGYA